MTSSFYIYLLHCYTFLFILVMYKRDINGTILYDVGDEYYNNSVIFEGVSTIDLGNLSIN